MGPTVIRNIIRINTNHEITTISTGLFIILHIFIGFAYCITMFVAPHFLRNNLEYLCMQPNYTLREILRNRLLAKLQTQGGTYVAKYITMNC